MEVVESCFVNQSLWKAIEVMRRDGAAWIPAMLTKKFRADLFEEVQTLPYRKADERVGEVYQVFEYCVFLETIRDYPKLELLRVETGRLIQRAARFFSPDSLEQWIPQEVEINKYGAGGGISAHRDSTKHPGVIAIWTICGACQFQLRESRIGRVTKCCRLGQGDLVLLRGAGDGSGLNEQRPFHEVRNLTGERLRISVAIRQNTRPGDNRDGFVYTNA